MKLYNTLTRTKETFKPITDKKVKIYTCGPTVYKPLHIGNWVAYIRWDTLIRTLTVLGYQPDRVLNITDVGHLVGDSDQGEDKMVEGARAAGSTAHEIANRYTLDFKKGMDELNLIIPQHTVAATDYIEQQILLIQDLENKGYTYRISDGIYFDTAKFPNYADFARLDLEGQQAGARVEFNPEKRNPSDFALWKFSPKDQQRDMEWQSPWGLGFPGWHIECSAIALDILGPTLDIHCGGIDHVPVHHTNEIAQSQAATGKKFSNYWLHNYHLLANGTKISKSLSNGFTIEDIKSKGFSPMDFKIFVLQSHYRTESNFTWDNLQSAQNRLSGLKASADIRFQLSGRKGQVTSRQYSDAKKSIIDSLADDMDTPVALREAHEILNLSSTLLPENPTDFQNFLQFLDDTLGLNLLSSTDITEPQKTALAERDKARNANNWQLSDEIRDELEAQGIGVRDTDRGGVWYRL